ncbi:MAG: integration host factor subunit beta [Magnetococcales bacterium]|nr:integration host factor subunit beta [Magnetococcales bacterium]
MTKQELMDTIAERNRLTRKEAELCVNVVLDCISDALGQKGKVELRGFGAFSCKKRPARIGRNPKTGAQVHVPAKYVPVFKAGKALRERVDK